jgi:hypothetical protein
VHLITTLKCYICDLFSSISAYLLVWPINKTMLRPKRKSKKHLCLLSAYKHKFLYPRSPKGEGSILFYLYPSVQDIFLHIFLSNCWCQKSDIWSQASYRYTILWVAFLDPSDSYFLLADLVGFYTHWTYTLYAHFSSHFSQQLLMVEIWYLVTSFI